MEPTLSTKVVTNEVRFAYSHVFEPFSMEENGDKKYSVLLLIDKNDKKTLDAIRNAIRAAANVGKNNLVNPKTGEIMKGVKNPLRDGDAERDGEEFKNKYFLNCSTKRQPSIVDAHLQPIINPEEFYSGCYGRASVNFYTYNVNGNKGVACGLNNLQKLRDGEHLGGSSAAQDFADSAQGGDDFFSGAPGEDIF
jgi:hypothetical protein